MIEFIDGVLNCYLDPDKYQFLLTLNLSVFILLCATAWEFVTSNSVRFNIIFWITLLFGGPLFLICMLIIVPICYLIVGLLILSGIAQMFLGDMNVDDSEEQEDDTIL